MNDLREKIESVLAPLRLAEVVGEPIEGAWVPVERLQHLQRAIDDVDAGYEAEHLRAGIETIVGEMQDARMTPQQALQALQDLLDETAAGDSGMWVDRHVNG